MGSEHAGRRTEQKRSQWGIAVMAGAAMSLSAAGCAAPTSGAQRVKFSEPPQLAQVSPGLWVVVDYPTPVFHYSGYYWMYDQDVWYRAPSYNQPWSRVSLYSLPGSLLRLTPRKFRFYQPSGNTVVTRADRYGPVLRTRSPREKALAPKEPASTPSADAPGREPN